MKTKFYILLTLLVFYTSSCHKPKIIFTYIELTETDKQMLPYELGQVINCIDKLRQPFQAIVIEDTTYWIEYIFDEDPRYEWHLNEECRMIKLQPNHNNFSINLSVVASDGNFLEVLIRINPLDCDFYLPYSKEDGQFITSSKQYFHESIKINDKIYYDVVSKYNGDFQVFYNKIYGILQIKRERENIFTINQ